MPNTAEARLSPLERRRLRLARASACLDMTLPAGHRLLKAYGLWCWRLKIPMVWCTSEKLRVRYVRFHLDMLTTANALTTDGQAALKALGASGVSAHEARWDRVPRTERERLGAAIFRLSVNPEYCRRAREVPIRKLQVVPGRKRAAGA
jgi:hypothetical protein